jgi:hypothetical protein
MYEFHKPRQLAPPCRSLPALSEDERCAWEERVAICTIDGGLSEAQAQEIAWAQIESQRATQSAAPVA